MKIELCLSEKKLKEIVKLATHAKIQFKFFKNKAVFIISIGADAATKKSFFKILKMVKGYNLVSTGR